MVAQVRVFRPLLCPAGSQWKVLDLETIVFLCLKEDLSA